jgi:hypothetical protein
MLDKRISIGGSGLPSAIAVGTAATAAAAAGAPNTANAVEAAALARPVELAVGLNGAAFTPVVAGSFARGIPTNMSVGWTARAAADHGDAGTTRVDVAGSLDCTGYMDFVVTVTPPAGATTVSIELALPANPSNAIMAMGLGLSGGYVARSPPDFDASQKSSYVESIANA